MRRLLAAAGKQKTYRCDTCNKTFTSQVRFLISPESTFVMNVSRALLSNACLKSTFTYHSFVKVHLGELMETLFCFSRVMILSPLFSGCIRAALQFAVGAGWLYQVGLAILLRN